MTRISVILPVLNPNPRYLREAVASVLAQSLSDLELLVVEDRGEVPVADLLSAFRDDRIRHLLHAQSGGLGAALNHGLAHSRAPFVARMDADDVCQRDRLAKQLAMFEADPALDVAGCQLTVIDADGEAIGSRTYPISHDAIARGFTRFNCVAHPTVVLRKSSVEAVGGYAVGMRAEDYDLWCRLLVRGSRFANHGERLLRYRFHPEALKYQTVRPELRAGMAIKRRYLRDRFDLRARARLVGERLLLLAPPRLVIALFRMTQYDRL
jgi:glycosyltransferase involved in cell wall biosynthesis